MSNGHHGNNNFAVVNLINDSVISHLVITCEL